MSSMVTEEWHARASHKIPLRRINKGLDGELRQREPGEGRDTGASGAEGISRKEILEKSLQAMAIKMYLSFERD